METASPFRRINVEKLISAVRPRPALYSKKERLAPEYKQKSMQQWSEVCRELHPAYDGWTKADKLEYQHEVYKRWRNLRACFCREVASQKMEKLKKNVKRKKRYEHYEALTFLLPEYEADSQKDSAVILQLFQSDDESSELADFEKSARSDSESLREMKSEVDVENYPETEFLDTDVQIEPETDRDIVETITEREKKEESDSDKLFMLSLVPSFRRIKPKRKLAAKIELLKVMQAFQDD